VKDSGFWLMTRYKDVRAAGLDWKRYSNAGGAAPLQFDLEVFRNGFLETDPPLHTKIREAVTPFFLQPALEQHEDGIRKIIGELIDEAVANSPVDFVETYAMSLPSRIFFELFLHEDPTEIAYTIEIVRGLLKDMASAPELAPKLQAWCAKAIAKRQKSGERDDMIGIIAHMGNDTDFTVTEQLRVETLMLLIMAGMETTANGLGAVIYTFATNPEARQRMANATPDKISKAADEFLRFSSPVPAAGRTLTEDAVVQGCPMKKGDRVTLNWLAANHDPEVFPNPDVLDLDRNASQHLAFGVGYHKCLGMHLAKRELRLTIEALSKLSTFELVPGTEINYRNGPARGLMSLPVICAR
jgi:cytochrome P450